jgi:hypothetical protein
MLVSNTFLLENFSGVSLLGIAAKNTNTRIKVVREYAKGITGSLSRTKKEVHNTAKMVETKNPSTRYRNRLDSLVALRKCIKKLIPGIMNKAGNPTIALTSGGTFSRQSVR